MVQANIQPFKKPISQFNIQLFPHPMFPGLSSAPLHCSKLLLCKHFIEVKLKVSRNWKSCTRTPWSPVFNCLAPLSKELKRCFYIHQCLRAVGWVALWPGVNSARCSLQIRTRARPGIRLAWHFYQPMVRTGEEEVNLVQTSKFWMNICGYILLHAITCYILYTSSTYLIQPAV